MARKFLVRMLVNLHVGSYTTGYKKGQIRVLYLQEPYDHGQCIDDLPFLDVTETGVYCTISPNQFKVLRELPNG